MIKKQNFKCKTCRKLFSRYIPPSDKRGYREFCSRSCQMKQTKFDQLGTSSGVTSRACEFCDKIFTKYSRASRPSRYCDKSCSSKHLTKQGKTCFASFQKMNKKRADKLRQIRSKLTTKSNIGRKLSNLTKQKISRSCLGNINKIKGKTFEEFYGPDRAKELSKNHSKKLKEGYASGRLNPSFYTKNAPTYNGIKLRSKLEFDVIKFLESTKGLEFGKTLLYEPLFTRVKWLSADGTSHTYIPDLYDCLNEIIYEVKPYWKVMSPSYEMVAKREAILTSRQTFKYITDNDIKPLRSND